MPELDRLDAKEVGSLAGLAPVTRQSGAWQGRSFIQGDRARVRRLLYMPALASIRYHQDLCAKYRQLVAEGKPRKVAVVGVMRERLVLANARLEQDRCWLPERPGRDSARFACSAQLARVCSSHAFGFVASDFLAPPWSGALGLCRRNHCSALRAMPSFARSENIRCAWGFSPSP